MQLTGFCNMSLFQSIQSFFCLSHLLEMTSYQLIILINSLIDIHLFSLFFETTTFLSPLLRPSPTRPLPGAFDLWVQTSLKCHAPDELSQQYQLPPTFLGAQTPTSSPWCRPADATRGGRAASTQRQKKATNSTEACEKQRPLHRRHEWPGDQRIASVLTGHGGQRRTEFSAG